MIKHNVEIWAVDKSGVRTRLGELRAENAGVSSREELEVLLSRVSRAVGAWRKVYPDDKIETVMVSRAVSRRAQRRQKISC